MYVCTQMYIPEAVTDATVSNVTVLFWLLTFSTASDYHIRVAQHLAVGGEGWGGVGRGGEGYYC